MSTTRIALLLAGLLSYAASDAAEPKIIRAGMDYAVPANSFVRFERYTKKDNTAHFSGRFTVTGTYVYGYAEEGENSWLDLYFVPDAPIAARLPHISGRETVRQLRFTNSGEFIAAVISPVAAAKLERREVKSVTGRATLNVDAYWGSIECGVEYYGARFLSLGGPLTVELQQTALAADHC